MNRSPILGSLRSYIALPHPRAVGATDATIGLVRLSFSTIRSCKSSREVVDTMVLNDMTGAAKARMAFPPEVQCNKGARVLCKHQLVLEPKAPEAFAKFSWVW